MALSWLRSVFFLALFYSGSCLAVEGIDEDMAEALIVRQLIGLIDWQQDMDKKSPDHLNVCSYRNETGFRLLKQLFKGEQKSQTQLSIQHVVERENVADCQVVFINKPEESDLIWFLEQQVPRQTLFILRGKQQAIQGFHFGIYLNNQDTFDLELNPDAFVDSRFNLNSKLLTLSKVLKSSIGRKVSLLRSLINYTEWPGVKNNFTNQSTFNLCSWRNKPLTTFFDYYAGNKSFKNRKLNAVTISSSEQANSCDAIVIGSAIDSHSISLLRERKQQKVLLIGNWGRLGEKGVHYNLNPLANETSRRFEMNLVAFDETGHSPHYELYNSAIVVEKDLPEFLSTITNIIELTSWPNELEQASEMSQVELCVYEDPQLYESLQLFLVDWEASLPAKKTISTRLVLDKSQLSRCQALLVSNTNLELSAMPEEQKSPILIIVNKAIERPNPFHYRVIASPKRVTFELNLEKLEKNGFRPAKSLLGLGKVITGGGDYELR